MESYLIVLNLLILFVSILGVLMSFLIWRESSTNDIHAQGEIIREEHQGEDLSIGFVTDGSIIHLNIKVDYVKCIEAEGSVVYALKRMVLGSDGETLIKMSVNWSRTPDEKPLLGTISLKETISEKETIETFDGKIQPSGWGKQSIVVHSTNPEKVREEVTTFFELLETSIQKKIDEDDLSNLDGLEARN